MNRCMTGRLGSSSVASRDLGLQHTVALSKMAQQRGNDLFGARQFGARSHPRALSNGTQQLCFNARPDTLDGKQFPGPGCHRELIDCIDAEFLVQQMHALWAQARESQQSRDPR
jgi:hypothetical protein